MFDFPIQNIYAICSIDNKSLSIPGFERFNPILVSTILTIYFVMNVLIIGKEVMLP